MTTALLTIKDYKAQFGRVRPAIAEVRAEAKRQIKAAPPLTQNLRSALTACLGPRAVQLGLHARQNYR